MRYTIFPAAGRIQWFVILVAIVAFIGLWRWKWNVVPVALGADVLGLVY